MKKMATAAEQFVENILKNNKVVVFSKTFCPFCKASIATLNKYNPDGMEVLQIDNRSDMAHIQDYLLVKTGGRTVPRIFVGGKFIGGNSEMATAEKSGKLKKFLEEAGAI